MSVCARATAGSGYEKNLGIMDTQRFKSVMGILFGGELTGHTLQSICMYYGTGGLDAGGVDHVSVLWKKFSIDFDNVPLFQEPEMPVDPELMAALRAMRSEATHKRLDMTDAFEEYSGTLQEKNTGIMSKNRFRSTMGTLFRGRLNQDVLNAICIHCTHHCHTAALHPQHGRSHAAHTPLARRLHAAGAVPTAARAPPHVRCLHAAARTPLAPHPRLVNAAARRLLARAVLSLTLVRLAACVSARASRCVRAAADGVGDPDPRERGSFTKVRWKQFAIDFDNIPPPPPPPLPDPSPEIVEAMRGMNVYANLNGIDLANDFEEYMGGKDKVSWPDLNSLERALRASADARRSAPPPRRALRVSVAARNPPQCSSDLCVCPWLPTVLVRPDAAREVLLGARRAPRPRHLALPARLGHARRHLRVLRRGRARRARPEVPYARAVARVCGRRQPYPAHALSRRAAGHGARLPAGGRVRRPARHGRGAHPPRVRHDAHMLCSELRHDAVGSSRLLRRAGRRRGRGGARGQKSDGWRRRSERGGDQVDALDAALDGARLMSHPWPRASMRVQGLASMEGTEGLGVSQACVREAIGCANCL
jgi:hypothetical protein